MFPQKPHEFNTCLEFLSLCPVATVGTDISSVDPKAPLLTSAAITCTLDMTCAGSIRELAKSEKKVNSKDVSPPKCFFL